MSAAYLPSRRMHSPSSLTWLITGCSSGLGWALARAALAQGHRVCATARNVAPLTALHQAYPDTCLIQPLDVTVPEQSEAVVAAAEAAFGRLDVLVHNAGIGHVASCEETSSAEANRLFAVNFFGPLRLTQVALPLFRRQRSGHVVFISAAAAIANYAGFGFYGASKRALEGAAEALSQEGRPFGLKVTIVQPGPFRTEFIARSTQAASGLSDYAATVGKFGRYLNTLHGKQPGDPERAADAILSAVHAERPPLRLVLGSYATDKARRTLAATQRELETWAPLAGDTEFSSSTPSS